MRCEEGRLKKKKKREVIEKTFLTFWLVNCGSEKIIELDFSIERS